jgi:hypothetical protein
MIWRATSIHEYTPKERSGIRYLEDRFSQCQPATLLHACVQRGHCVPYMLSPRQAGKITEFLDVLTWLTRTRLGEQIAQGADSGTAVPLFCVPLPGKNVQKIARVVPKQSSPLMGRPCYTGPKRDVWPNPLKESRACECLSPINVSHVQSPLV